MTAEQYWNQNNRETAGLVNHLETFIEPNFILPGLIKVMCFYTEEKSCKADRRCLMNPGLPATKTICEHFVNHFAATGGPAAHSAVCCTLAVQVVCGQLLPLWQGAEQEWPQSWRASLQGWRQLPPAKHSPRWQIRLQQCISHGNTLLHVRPQEMSCRWHGMLLRCCGAKENVLISITGM